MIVMLVGGEIAIVTVAAVVPAAFVALIVTMDTPRSVGVPLITPVAGFKLRLGGSEPLETVQLLYGGVPPVAARLWE